MSAAAGGPVSGAMLSSMNQHMGAGKGVGSLLDFSGAKGGQFPSLFSGLSVSPMDSVDLAKTLGGLNPPQPQLGAKLTQGFGQGLAGGGNAGGGANHKEGMGVGM